MRSARRPARHPITPAIAPPNASALSFTPIGVLRTPFPDKFGIPRQPGLVPDATGVLELPPSLRDSARGLEAFTHAWVIFHFHSAHASSNLVRPPRLGGASKRGVFATRTPHRPNLIGLSVFEIESISPTRSGGIEIRFNGVDVLDGSPVLDVKPYLPYIDSIRGARAEGWAAGGPKRQAVRVLFERPALAQCRALEAENRPGLRTLVRKLLALDPRPAHQARGDKPRRTGRAGTGIYSMRLLDVDVHWRVGATDGTFHVIGINRV